ncbi:MAG: DUF2786 domain-containing protein [Actinomycetota bacterium]|nr:DUF2786 domain-containing protein [Actinomycetota bacterium]
MLVLAGGGAAAKGDEVTFEEVSLALLGQANSLGQETVGAVLSEVVSSVLSQDFEHGWQPREVVRASRRRRSGRHTELLITAMGADGVWREAKGASPPPAWREQLDELEVSSWWGSGLDWLGPWTRRARLGWPEGLMMALETLGVLMVLPDLAALLPPPSQWAGWRPTSANHDADDPILAKVRALLAKAESTSFEAEAEALSAKAQQLMARHAIDEAIARNTGDARAEKPAARRFAVDDPYASAKSRLLSAVAATNGGRSIWYEEFALMAVVAFEADLDAIDTLFTSLLVQGTRAMLAKGRVVDGRGRSRTRSFRQSFLLAFADRIHERLEQAAAAARHEAEEELSRSVLPVLAGRDGEVDDAVEAMFPNTRRMRGSRITSREGWAAGRTAAELASLGPEGALTREATA